MRRRIAVPLVALGLVLAVLVVADRVGVVVAQRRAESTLASYAQFRQRPTVLVHGVPFLTQVVQGRYGDIEVRGPLVGYGSFAVADLDVHLRGAHLPLSSVAGGRVTELPVDRAQGQVTIPYAELARRSSIPGLTLRGDSAGVTAEADVRLPLLGAVSRVRGRGTIALDGNRIRLVVSGAQLAGAAVPEAVLAELQRQWSLNIALPSLPLNLRLTGITSSQDGVLVSGSATDVVLRGAG